MECFIGRYSVTKSDTSQILLLTDTVLSVREFVWQIQCYQLEFILADTVLLELLPVKRETCELITCMTDLRTCLVIG